MPAVGQDCAMLYAPDRPMLGIVLMIGFCVTAPLGDGVAKLLGEVIPLGQLVMLRFVLQTVLLLPFVLLVRRSLWMTRRVFWLAALRTGLHIVGIGAMFLSLRFLPLAEAIAIAFVMPFILLLLGHTMMGEEVGMRRLAACAVGFAGTLLVIQPKFAAVGWAALLPLAVAVAFAVFMMVTRLIARDTDPVGLQAVSGLMASVVLVPLVLLANGSGIAWLDPVSPQPVDWALIVVLGVLGTAGHLLMTWSLRFAPASTLAPMQYLEIPFATLIGWAIFGDLPGGLAALGIVITVGAGLYIILREQSLSRAAAVGSGGT